MRRGLTFDGGIRGYNHLADTPQLHTDEQAFNVEFLRSDSMQRIKSTTKYVKDTAKLPSALNRPGVECVFDDTDHAPIARIVAAHRAEFFLGK